MSHYLKRTELTIDPTDKEMWRRVTCLPFPSSSLPRTYARAVWFSAHLIPKYCDS